MIDGKIAWWSWLNEYMAFPRLRQEMEKR